MFIETSAKVRVWAWAGGVVMGRVRILTHMRLLPVEVGI